jgi:hypothetical protein
MSGIPPNLLCITGDLVATDGDELDRLELVEGVSELLRGNAEYADGRHDHYAPTRAEIGDHYSRLVFPDHPAVREYRVALMFARVAAPPDMDLKTARAHFKECAEQYYSLCEWRGASVEWVDGGKGVSLRAILDAERIMVAAYHAMIDAEYREIKCGKRYFPVNGLIKTRRTVLVGDVRVPVMKKVQP